MRRIVVALLAILLTTAVSATEIGSLKCEFLSNPLGIDSNEPTLSWTAAGAAKGDIQTYCRILVASSPDLLAPGRADLWDSGKIRTRLQAVRYGGKKLRAGDAVWWKVMIRTRKGGATQWSEAAFFSVGLLEQSDWKASYIQLDSDTDCPLFWKRFGVDSKDGAYLLHVNSLGYHEVWLNGAKVGDTVLQPAVCQADKRSLICTYDLTSQISEGNNDLVIWLSDGWMRAYENRLCPHPAFRAQLQQIHSGEVTDILCSDTTWYSRESGWSVSGNWKPFNFGGDMADARLMLDNFGAESLQKASWQNASIAEVVPHSASPQMVEPCRIIKSFAPVSIKQEGKDSWLIDFGTCLTGMFEIEFPRLKAGQRIVMDYADCLDQNDAFPLVRRGDFKDVYIASGKEGEHFCGRFDFHGYRYVLISGLTEEPAAESMRAHLVHTDYGNGATFESSDEELNAIHDMIRYTIECLTPGGYMVDCPHIERLGYGGDGNASTPTLQTIFNPTGLMYNWAQAWADAQRENGGMPHTAPAPYGAGGGPFWCGFLIVASWQSYLRFGDERLIARFYPAMKRWMDYVAEYSPEGLLQRWDNDPIRRGWFLGDWAAPEKVNVTDSTTVSLMANCFISECYETMARIAEFNRERNQSRVYSKRACNIREELHKRYFVDSTASYATGSQIDYCYPMLAGVTPKQELARVERALEQAVDTLYQGNLAAGLAGVPVVTRWATAAHRPDMMMRMLKSHSYPGYLYMIDNGATTTWEYWNGYRSHIHNCYNGIGSWFYEALGGITPDPLHPGFRHFRVEPQIVSGLTHVKVKMSVPLGEIVSEWTTDNGKMALKLSVPFGATATVILPDGKKRKVGCGDHSFESKIN